MSNNGSLSSAPAIAGLTAEMAKVPKSDAAVSWNATALAAITTQADLAVDLVKAQNIKQMVLNDSFLLGAEGAQPDATFWTTVQDAGATVEILLSAVPVYLRLYAGVVGTEDAYVHGKDKIAWSIEHAEATEIHFRTRVRCADLTGQFGFGLMVQQFSDLAAEAWTTAQPHAGIKCDNDVVSATTGDGAVEETTDISAHFTENAWLLIEIISNSSDVTFYINGTLRATHSTRIPVHSMSQNLGAKNTNGIATELQIQNVQIWTL